MMNKQAFEALDRSLRDIMGQVNPNFKNIPFGNKIIIFGNLSNTEDPRSFLLSFNEAWDDYFKNYEA